MQNYAVISIIGLIIYNIENTRAYSDYNYYFMQYT